jgi:hypothetical protein
MQQVVGIVIGAALIAGVSQSASAQCPPGAQVFIDPRLAPQRPHMSREDFERVMASPWMPDWQKKQYQDLYLNQNQPIQVPLNGGVVLVHPADPCIQQYIGQ